VSRSTSTLQRLESTVTPPARPRYSPFCSDLFSPWGRPGGVNVEANMSDPVLPAPCPPALSPLASATPPSPRPLPRLGGLLRHASRRVLRHPRRVLGVAVLLGLLALGGSLAARHARAVYHLRTGRADLARHHNRDALTHFQACLLTRPDNPDVLLL